LNNSVNNKTFGRLEPLIILIVETFVENLLHFEIIPPLSPRLREGEINFFSLKERK